MRRFTPESESTLALVVLLLSAGCGGKSGSDEAQDARAVPVVRRENQREFGAYVRISAGDVTIERSLPSASFALEEGDSLDWRLPSGPFEAEITVNFNPGSVREAYLGAEIQGGGLIVYRGEEMIRSSYADRQPKLVLTHQPIVLSSRREQVRYVFISDASRPVRFRAMWQPLETTMAHSLPSTGAPLLGDDVRRGMQLAIDLHCAACHRSENPQRQRWIEPAAAPSLDRVGERIHPGWLRNWILDPKGVDVLARMPRLLHESPSDDDAIEDLVSFLVSRGGPLEDGVELVDAELRTEGRRLFHLVGCVPCHGPLESASDVFGVESKSTSQARFYRSLKKLRGKTTVGALAAYLYDPLTVHPDGRMPSLNLTKRESMAVAIYLQDRLESGSEEHTEQKESDPGQVIRGRDRFLKLRCVNCHSAGFENDAERQRLNPKSLEAIAVLSDQSSTGCLQAEPAPGVPAYELNETQRAQLRAFLKSLAVSQSTIAPVDELLSTIERLNCSACHGFHGESGPEPAIKPFFQYNAQADLGDEGRMPPELTDAGSRLTTAGLHHVLVEGERARPYMRTHMPHFGEANVGPLPGLFAAGGNVMITQSESVLEPVDADMLEAGRMLVGDQGFNCIKCHAWQSSPATEFPGPDLTAMPRRLRYEWFERLVTDPKWINTETRMTKFFHSDRSKFTEIHKGHSTEQIRAIWEYVSRAETLPPPSGLIAP